MKPAIHGVVQIHNNYMLCVDSIDWHVVREYSYVDLPFTIVRRWYALFDPIITLQGHTRYTIPQMDAHVRWS